MADVEEQLIVKAKIDRASFSTAEQVVKRFENSALGKLGASSANRLRTVYARVSNASQEATRNIEASNSALREQSGLLDRIDGQAGAVGGNTRRSTGANRSAAETTDRIGSIGSQVAGALGAGELANTAGLIGDVGGALSSLGPPGLVAVASIAALSLAFGELNRTIEAGKVQLRTALQVNSSYYDAIESGTSEQVRQQIATLETSRAALQAQAQQLRTNVNQAFEESARQLGDAGARALFASGAFGDLQEAATAAEQELASNVQLTDRLTTALNNNAFALNDARAAAERFNEQFTDTVLSGARAIEENAMRVAEIDNLSSEAAQERIRSLEDERAAVQASITYLEQYAAGNAELQQELANLRDRLYDLEAETQQVNSALDTTIAAREREQAAAEAHQNALERAAEARKREMQTIVDNVGAISDAYNRIKDIQARAAEETQKIAADLVRREAQTAQTLADRRQDVFIDAARQEIEDAARNASELRRIEREAARASKQAVGNRDALSLLQAKQAKADQLEDQKAADDDENAQQKRALEAQLKDAQRTYERQVRDAQQAAREQQAASRAKLNNEVAAQRAIITTAQSALQSRVRMEAGAYGQMANNVFSFVQRMAQAAAALNSVQVGPPKGTGAVKGGTNGVDLRRLNSALRTITAD